MNRQILTHWIARVRNNDVVLILTLLHEFKSIVDIQMHFWIIESNCHRWNVLFTQFDHSFVNFHLVYICDSRVFGHFSCNATITTADNQNLGRTGELYELKIKVLIVILINDLHF